MCCAVLSRFSHVWHFVTPLDCSLPGFSVLGILQARILGWVAISFSKECFTPKDWTCVLCLLLHWQVGSLPLAPPRKSLKIHKSREIKDCRLLGQTPKKDVLFIIGDWNAKVGIQVTPGVTGKFGLRVQNEAGQRLIEFCQENALVVANTLFQQRKRKSTHGHHQMVNTKIRLVIFFAAKGGEALYSQQKQDRELTVAQIMNSLLPNSDLNWRK